MNRASGGSTAAAPPSLCYACFLLAGAETAGEWTATLDRDSDCSSGVEASRAAWPALAGPGCSSCSSGRLSGFSPLGPKLRFGGPFGGGEGVVTETSAEAAPAGMGGAGGLGED
eukprot:2253097-Pyramimonas_sp.AAC.1